jgi:hypothetical protein
MQHFRAKPYSRTDDNSPARILLIHDNKLLLEKGKQTLPEFDVTVCSDYDDAMDILASETRVPCSWVTCHQYFQRS